MTTTTPPRYLTKLRLLAAALGILVASPTLPAAEADASGKPNVLFIAVDDLNHWVGHLGRNPQTKTPNIDRLARMGVTFTRAYCAAPVCNPSRAALLSGRRPGVTGVYDNQNPYTGVIRAEESLVMQFKNAGYETLGMGKLWHGGLGFPEQWSGTGGKERTEKANVDDRSIGGIAFGAIEGGDESVQDTRIAGYGIEQLGRAHAQPFFLTLGFHKPHMPWNVPQKYYDLHPLDQIELPPHREGDLDDLPPAGVKMAGPLGDHAKVLASGRWKEAVQAYLAAISYLDAQVGRVLDAFEKSAYADNTILCFWGDHGWHLGEKEHWRKFTLWEEATRAPLIWVVPGMTKPGSVCERTVDFMSIYPTLCDLAGVPVPKHVEGADIRPLLSNPSAEWKIPAITTFRQNNHTVRTEQWRYIRYDDGGEELYDHDADPYEWKNLAGQSAKFNAIQADLAQWLPNENVAPTPPVAGKRAKGKGARKQNQDPIRFHPVKREVEGWTVHVEPSLLDGEHAEEGAKALTMLANHLQRIAILVPPEPLAKLRKVEIWIEHEHPTLHAMQYHPSRGWLIDNGHDPRLARKVHITRASELLSRSQMLKHPAVILHELAHGYHDQVLDFDNPEIIAAYEKAKAAGSYEKVLLFTGDTVRHYGLTNHKEYFAEGTEAYLYRNDFYPFVRAELEIHDPTLHAVLEKVWGPAD